MTQPCHAHLLRKAEFFVQYIAELDRLCRNFGPILLSKICLQPEDEYGSPSLDEIALFSRHFSEEYHRAIGEAAEEVAVEVSSPVSHSMQMPSLQTCSLDLCYRYLWYRYLWYSTCHVPCTMAHESLCKSIICACLCLSRMTLFVAPSNTQLRIHTAYIIKTCDRTYMEMSNVLQQQPAV